LNQLLETRNGAEIEGQGGAVAEERDRGDRYVGFFRLLWFGCVFRVAGLSSVNYVYPTGFAYQFGLANPGDFTISDPGSSLRTLSIADIVKHPTRSYNYN
jgi:hypothetical protein